MESPKAFLNKCVRVWKVLRKPSREEFLNIAKVSAVGILIVGLVGFIISTLIRFFLK
ncbi:MAG: protein translocase SEC61 complex subunit gamma [Nanoarchaeota archaeon]